MTKDTEALREALKDLARGVFIDAATITHHSWVDGTNGREPDFDEYAGDYAESFADAYVDNITAALATPASDVAPVGDYHVTAAQYEAAVKGRQDFRQAYREQLNLLSQKEWAAVAQIGADQELSTSAVLRQAVRLYQMHLYRLKAGETLSWSGDEQRAKDFAGPLYAHPPHPAPVDSDEAVRLLRGIVRLSEMGFEASMREPEEDGNYAVYIRAKAFLDGHPSSVALSDALRDIPDEVYRHIAESKDVAHARSRVADLVAQLPLTTPVDPVAGGEALREALRRAALRLEICAGYIDSSFGLSGTRRAERAMKAKHFALEALAALKGPAA